MTDREYSNEVSIEYVILNHLVQIGLLSTRLYSTTRSEWQTNALNYVTAIENLEALSQPFLSLTYLQRVSELDTKYRNNIESYKNDKAELNEAYLKKGQNYEMGLTIAYAIVKFKYIQIELNSRGILRKSTASATDDGAAGAEVSEEVGDAGSGTPDTT